MVSRYWTKGRSNFVEISIPMLTVRLLRQTTVGGVIIGSLMNGQLTSPGTATQTPPIMTMYMPSQFVGSENQYGLCITAADRFRFFDRRTAATYSGKMLNGKRFVSHDKIPEVNPFVPIPPAGRVNIRN